jgi:hypothetical protein
MKARLIVRMKDSPDAMEIDKFVLNPDERMDVPVGLVHQMEA